jgi:hypothetical protein
MSGYVMNETEMRKRALLKAREDRRRALFVDAKPALGVIFFRVKCGGSCLRGNPQAEPHRYHQVTVIRGRVHCDDNCPRERYNKPCVHKAAVERRREREAKRKAS